MKFTLLPLLLVTGAIAAPVVRNNGAGNLVERAVVDATNAMEFAAEQRPADGGTGSVAVAAFAKSGTRFTRPDKRAVVDTRNDRENKAEDTLPLYGGGDGSSSLPPLHHPHAVRDDVAGSPVDKGIVNARNSRGGPAGQLDPRLASDHRITFPHSRRAPSAQAADERTFQNSSGDDNSQWVHIKSPVNRISRISHSRRAPSAQAASERTL